MNADDSIEHNKARLVVKAYSLIAGIDYQETVASVTRYDSLCLIIALAVNFALSLKEPYIKSIFLNGNLEVAIWMILPIGIGLNVKVHLHMKVLYGLKDALLK